MTEADEHEQNEPEVSDVPEPDQDVNEDEAEEDGAAETQTDADQQEEAPQNVVTAEAWEKRHKSADKAFATYEKRVRAIYEGDADQLVACPLCGDTPSGFLDPGAAGRTDPEVAQIVTQFMTGVSQEDFEAAPDTEQCPRCKGKGELLTGSRIDRWRSKTCENCHGAGYVGPGNPMHAPPVRSVNETTPTGNGEAGAGVVDVSAALEAMQHVGNVPQG